MRAMVGVLALLVVVAIVGVLAKKNLSSVSVPASSQAVPAAPGQPAVAAPTGSPKQQLDQVKQSVEGAMQQARPVDDSK
ncbi:hypothetical protein [Ramlibacter sp.]|uniref:hypothetical protein n=1 Tax=Ramlibacter sp. TaxID=1917967 RepID=UPI003D09B40A